MSRRRTRFDKQSTSSTPRRATWSFCARTRRATATSPTWSPRRLPRASTSSPASTWSCCAQHAKGLIALSACLAGEIPRRLRNGEYDNAKAYALDTRGDVWPGPLLSGASGPRHPRSGGQVNAGLAAASTRRRGMPLVCTNDAHYLREGGRRGARRAAVHPDGQDRGRREPDALRAAELLPPLDGGDGGAFRPIPGRDRKHREDRGDVQFGVHLRQVPPAGIQAAGGLRPR